jgi:SNF2 family DNA or RNA helicase
MGMRKVKLPGRRRLCKLSNTSSSPCPPDAADHHELQDVGAWETGGPTEDSRDEDDDHGTYSAREDEEEEEGELPDFQIEAAGGSVVEEPYKLPARILNKLYAHQREGLAWLWSLHCKGTGGILGDDMGLGKTMQVHPSLRSAYPSILLLKLTVILLIVKNTRQFVSFLVPSLGLIHPYTSLLLLESSCGCLLLVLG